MAVRRGSRVRGSPELDAFRQKHEICHVARRRTSNEYRFSFNGGCNVIFVECVGALSNVLGLGIMFGALYNVWGLGIMFGGFV